MRLAPGGSPSPNPNRDSSPATRARPSLPLGAAPTRSPTSAPSPKTPSSTVSPSGSLRSEWHPRALTPNSSAVGTPAGTSNEGGASNEGAGLRFETKTNEEKPPIKEENERAAEAKSVEYVQQLFGVENDFTKEEEEKLRKENEWAFQDVDLDYDVEEIFDPDHDFTEEDVDPD